MQRKMRVLIAALLLVMGGALCVGQARAQYAYVGGVGLKFGYPYVSVDGKYFLNDYSAIEGLLNFGAYGVGVTALYEYHGYIPGVPGLRWYAGGGAHVGSLVTSTNYTFSSVSPYTGWYGYNKMFVYENGVLQSTRPAVALGVDAVLGLEYTFKNVPISLSLDVVPLLNFLPQVQFWWNSGITVRYLFR